MAAACAIGLVAPTVAEAKNDERGRPWARGTWSLGPGIGFGFGGDVTSLSFGVGGEYYVLNGWSFGADISDSIFIYTHSFRSEFPDVENQIATNAFFFIPQTRYVFFRSYRFSPWAYAGVGPVALNHGGGAVGQWITGPGAYIGLAGPVYLSIGVSFSGLFPRGKCLDGFTYTDPASPGTAIQFDLICGFRWSPNIGIVIAPQAKTRRQRRTEEEEERRRREEERRRAEKPIENPMQPTEPPPEPTPEPTPVEPAPEPTPEPTDPATEPARGEPAPEPTEPAPGDAPTDVQPDPVGPTPPPSEPAPTRDPDPSAGPRAPSPGR